jgi:hypothetical protein
MARSGFTKSYLVECYWPGVSEQTLLEATHRARKATAELQQEGKKIRFLDSILVLADETVFWLFQGSEAAVRTASTRAGVPFERVLESVRVDGRTPKEEK